ncbi:hypothetical protein PanWU01x14_078440 [Parasponia andersonii]|uniref:Uncharacterized protein n=1 Tax=Parasponia andersonii TaxID=3476 RepID=A0A2P5DBZ7_PARAD|nr:hypothetical protein PanWU01x14_078440 [Parasponia andersonii]
MPSRHLGPETRDLRRNGGAVSLVAAAVVGLPERRRVGHETSRAAARNLRAVVVTAATAAVAFGRRIVGVSHVVSRFCCRLGEVPDRRVVARNLGPGSGDEDVGGGSVHGGGPGGAGAGALEPEAVLEGLPRLLVLVSSDEALAGAGLGVLVSDDVEEGSSRRNGGWWRVGPRR